MVMTVPCPDPCLNAVATFVKVTWSIVKFPTFPLLDGAAPCRLPAAIAASVVLAKSTYDKMCLSSVPVLHAAVNARPFQVAPPCPSNKTGSDELPVALKELHAPSNDRPLPGAT